MTPKQKKAAKKLSALAKRTQASGKYSFFHWENGPEHVISVFFEDNSTQAVCGMSWNRETGLVSQIGASPEHRTVVAAMLHEAVTVAQLDGFEVPSRGEIMTSESARLARKINPEAMKYGPYIEVDEVRPWETQVKSWFGGRQLN